jgi:hypothetical protein
LCGGTVERIDEASRERELLLECQNKKFSAAGKFCLKDLRLKCLSFQCVGASAQNISREFVHHENIRLVCRSLHIFRPACV